MIIERDLQNILSQPKLIALRCLPDPKAPLSIEFRTFNIHAIMTADTSLNIAIHTKNELNDAH